MFTHAFDPVLLSLGPLEIRYYGLAYVLGFFFCVWWLQYFSEKGKLNLTKDEIWDFVFYLMVGVLVGSRLFMIFWQPQLYLLHPLEIFKIWNGGMSFHGGLVGIIAAGYWYLKKKKISFLHAADLIVTPTMFALALGRLANFMNAELVGKITNVSWCWNFPRYEGCRHPSTLYAAGKRFLVLSYLWILTIKGNFKEGFIFWNFIFWEGLGRFVVDFYRYEPIIIFGLTIGQWFSLVMIFISGYYLFTKHKNDWKRLLVNK